MQVVAQAVSPAFGPVVDFCRNRIHSCSHRNRATSCLMSSTRLPVPGAKVELRKSSNCRIPESRNGMPLCCRRLWWRGCPRNIRAKGSFSSIKTTFGDGKPPVERAISVPITRAATSSGVLKDGAAHATSNKEGVFRAEVPPRFEQNRRRRQPDYSGHVQLQALQPRREHGAIQTPGCATSRAVPLPAPLVISLHS
jgi:hypothetical protein